MVGERWRHRGALGRGVTSGYHRPVTRHLGLVLAWAAVVLAAALPWLSLWRPELAAVAAVLALAAARGAPVRPAGWPWRLALAALSGAGFLAWRGSAAVLAAWLAPAAVAGIAAWALPGRGERRPSPADLVALSGWAGLPLAWPVAGAGLGWIAGGLVVGAARLAGAELSGLVRRPVPQLGPPTREVRGTFGARALVVGGDDGLPRSVPIELELRAGDSLAILCDSLVDGHPLAETLAGRRPPLGGEVSVDGEPLTAADRLVALIAPGEELVEGGLEANMAALVGGSLEPAALVAVREACSLDEVAAALGGRLLRPDGRPLSAFHTLLLLAARVIPSHYRVLVVLDPMPWVNTVRGELWRAAVVRASVGRTALWITADRTLAERADRVVVYRSGSLRPVADGASAGRS
jgi:hypothetical protein